MLEPRTKNAMFRSLEYQLQYQSRLPRLGQPFRQRRHPDELAVNGDAPIYSGSPP
jgi:hypothetical protein